MHYLTPDFLDRMRIRRRSPRHSKFPVYAHPDSEFVPESDLYHIDIRVATTCAAGLDPGQKARLPGALQRRAGIAENCSKNSQLRRHTQAIRY